MINDLHLQAPWVGKTPEEYYGTTLEEDEFEYIDRLIDERRDEEYFEKVINKNE